jgi:ABC-type multidrug transport system fused ATPase/permease subunit
VLLFFQAIGDIAWLPILLIWFGFGLTTMTFVIVYTVVWSFSTPCSVSSLLPRDLARAARSLGASRARVLWEVTLPGALPNIITGLRNGLGYGWRALIAVEIIVGTSGIGFMMFDARRAGSTVEIILGMIILGLLWYIVDAWILAPSNARPDNAGDWLHHEHACRSATSRKLTSIQAVAHVNAVHDVSLDVEQGEFVSVVGPSGCGKTTILNMVAGFIPHSGGEILLNGKPIDGPGRSAAWCFSRSRSFHGRRCSTMSASARRCAACPRPSATRSQSIWRSPASHMQRTAIPTNSPAACSSASAWSAPSPTTQRCC